jgi:hypothetical protein
VDRAADIDHPAITENKNPAGGDIQLIVKQPILTILQEQKRKILLVVTYNMTPGSAASNDHPAMTNKETQCWW